MQTCEICLLYVGPGELPVDEVALAERLLPKVENDVDVWRLHRAELGDPLHDHQALREVLREVPVVVVGHELALVRLLHGVEEALVALVGVDHGAEGGLVRDVRVAHQHPVGDVVHPGQVQAVLLLQGLLDLHDLVADGDQHVRRGVVHLLVEERGLVEGSLAVPVAELAPDDDRVPATVKTKLITVLADENFIFYPTPGWTA